MTASILEGIPGLGPTRRQRLLDDFGTIDAIRGLSLEEISSIGWLPREIGDAIFDRLHPSPRLALDASSKREADSPHG